MLKLKVLFIIVLWLVSLLEDCDGEAVCDVPWVESAFVLEDCIQASGCELPDESDAGRYPAVGPDGLL